MDVWRKQRTPNFPKNEHFLLPDTHIFPYSVQMQKIKCIILLSELFSGLWLIILYLTQGDKKMIVIKLLKIVSFPWEICEKNRKKSREKLYVPVATLNKNKH